MATVDVIVPCYRYGRYLEQCVLSVLDQAGVDVRVIILDDCSPDDTPAVAEMLRSRDARVHYSRNAENRGHIATYNLGLEWISADYYLLLSADDYLLPGALLRATSLMEDNPTVVFCFGESLVSNSDGTVACAAPLGAGAPGAGRVLETSEFVRLSGAKNIVPTPTAVIRTAVQKECGGYRPEYPHAGDMEMWLRLSVRGQVGFVGEAQAVYRQHESNMSRAYLGASIHRDLKERRDVLDRFFREDGSGLAESEALRENCIAALASDALGAAHDAFHHTELAGAEELAHFASSLWPPIRRSRQWWKLSAKRFVGPRVWLSLRASLRSK